MDTGLRGSKVARPCDAPNANGGLPRLPAHFATIVKLLVLTGQRRGEIAALRAEYFSWDTSNDTSANSKDLSADQAVGAQRDLSKRSNSASSNLCTLPPTPTKNGREHTFPIATSTASLLQEHLQISSGSLLFPARGTSSQRAFNGWSKSKKALDKCSLSPIYKHLVG